MFNTEAERQRAREAGFTAYCKMNHGDFYVESFDRLYPPVVVAPEDGSEHFARASAKRLRDKRLADRTPSPAFVAALARYTETLHALYAPSRLTGYFDTAASYTTARAEVLRVHVEEVDNARHS